MRVLHGLRRYPRPTASVALILFVLTTFSGAIHTCASAMPARAAATAHAEHASPTAHEHSAEHSHKHSSGSHDPQPACPHCGHDTAALCVATANCGATSAAIVQPVRDADHSAFDPTSEAPLRYRPPPIPPPEPHARGSGAFAAELEPHRRCSLTVLFCVFLE